MLVQASEIINPFLMANTEPLQAVPRTKKKPRVLLIDDDLDMGEIVKNSLKFRYNCRVDIASDPFEAMNTMTENFYDLIILDWRLPALNGGQTLKELEKGFYFEPALPIQWDKQRVPVIVFSAGDKAQCTLERTKHFDCVGFISKRQPLNAIVEAFGQHIVAANEKNN